MKQIYILLSRTGTVPSKLIYTLTRGRFTHTSIALTPSTSGFYSYARRKIKNPLRAGLKTEDIHTEVFSKYPYCHCALFTIEVSEAGYHKIQTCLDDFMAHYNEAKYNFWGILPLRLGIRWNRKYRLTCSQFAAVLLAASEEIQLPKDPYLMLPNDFEKIPSLRKIYEGVLTNCQFKENMETVK